MAILFPAIAFTACSDDEPKEPLRAKFKESSIILRVDETSVLQVVIESGNIEMDKAVWKSSNNDVATVSNGIVTAVSVGKVDISLSYNGKFVASCKITVSPIKASSVVLSEHNLNMIIGESVELYATIEPFNTTNKEIKWETSNKKVATVTDEGIITAVSIGSVTIKAVVPGTDISDKCEITVNPKAVTGIECQSNASVLLGETVKIKASVKPIDASNTSIVWTSLNPEIANVDSSGNVKGVALGTAIIVAKTIDGEFEGSCSVEVFGIDQCIKIFSSQGTEGSTSSGFYSYLRLNINTNSTQKIYINSILLVDENNYLKFGETPNISCIEYTNKYVTVNHGNSHGNTFMADGWKFIIDYTWNGKNYQYTHTHKGGILM